MEEFSRILFGMSCYKNTEKIAKCKNNSDIERILFERKSLGTGFCSIINSEGLVRSFKKYIEENIGNYISDNDRIDENINKIYQDFLKLNSYFVFTKNSFIDCSHNIKLDINTKQETNKTSIYLHHLSIVFYHIIKSIMITKKWFIEGVINAFYLPSAYTTINMKKEKGFTVRYSYRIDSFDAFLAVSFYQLMLNKIHIKQCQYPNCNKFFLSKQGQTRYCDNPCPDNQNETCRSVKKKISLEDDLTDYEFELSELDRVLNTTRTNFSDSQKREKNVSKKKSIIQNAEKFKKISKELKIIIKASENEKREKYLIIYKNFLEEVSSNLKKSPKIFKVTKPKY